MAVDEPIVDRKLTKARKQGFGLGLLKGLRVTLRHMLSHNQVIQYPDVKQDLSPRTRGVIALKEENCTVCMLCGRECPDWCIYIDSHKETLPPKREGGRARKRNVLDRFAIDYALCMYCGICVEVCPYDALFWSREFEYAEYDIRELTHEKERLSDWMATVLPPPPLEEGAEVPGVSQVVATAAAEAPAKEPEPAAEAPPEPPAEKASEAKQTVEPDKPERALEPSPGPSPEEIAKLQEMPGPNVEVPSETPRPSALIPTEDPEAVYKQVLQEQLDKGSSPQVAEARAKVARVKAERGIKRGPTPVHVESPVPSAPMQGEEVPSEPSGAPAVPSAAPVQGEAKDSNADGGSDG